MICLGTLTYDLSWYSEPSFYLLRLLSVDMEVLSKDPLEARSDRTYPRFREYWLRLIQPLTTSIPTRSHRG
jgi:hypothetical protein